MTGVWIVGVVKAVFPEGLVWEIHSIQLTRRRAVAQCVDGRYFIGFVEVGKAAPAESTQLPFFEVPVKGAA